MLSIVLINLDMINLYYTDITENCKMDTSKASSLGGSDIFIITRSSEQNSHDLNTEETGETGQNEGGIVVFDDILAYNQKAIDPLFTRRDLKNPTSLTYPNPVLIHRKGQ